MHNTDVVHEWQGCSLGLISVLASYSSFTSVLVSTIMLIYISKMQLSNSVLNKLTKLMVVYAAFSFGCSA